MTAISTAEQSKWAAWLGRITLIEKRQASGTWVTVKGGGGEATFNWSNTEPPRIGQPIRMSAGVPL